MFELPSRTNTGSTSLVWIIPELRADCSRRSETNKRDVTLLRMKTYSFPFQNTAHNDASPKRDFAFGRMTLLRVRCLD